MPGRPADEIDPAEAAKIEATELAEAKQTFDRKIKELEKQWRCFDKHEARFKNFRDKRIAHLEVSKYKDKYGPMEVKPI